MINNNSSKNSNFTQSITDVNQSLNQGNLDFDFITNDGLYYNVKVGADTVRKKLGSAVISLLAQRAAGVNSGATSINYSYIVLEDGQMIINIVSSLQRVFSCYCRKNGVTLSARASGMSQNTIIYTYIFDVKKGDTIDSYIYGDNDSVSTIIGCSITAFLIA